MQPLAASEGVEFTLSRQQQRLPAVDQSGRRCVVDFGRHELIRFHSHGINVNLHLRDLQARPFQRRPVCDTLLEHPTCQGSRASKATPVPKWRRQRTTIRPREAKPLRGTVRFAEATALFSFFYSRLCLDFRRVDQGNRLSRSPSVGECQRLISTPLQP